MNLDNLPRFREIDTTNLITQIEALPNRVEAAWAHAQTLALPDGFRVATHVLIVGRGDSAIAGELARYAALESHLPITLWRENYLPVWVNTHTLVVAISFSGNTAETVAVAEAAVERGASVLTISTGGKLAALNNTLAWSILRQAQDAVDNSRTAVGELAILALAALVKLGAAQDKAAEVAEAVSELKTQQTNLCAESPVMKNPAKRMAGQIMNRYAALFVNDELAPAGRYWQSKINQFAKAWAQYIPLAEADHAMQGSVFPEALVEKYMALWLRGSRPSAQSDAVRAHFMTSGFNTDFVAASGQSALAQLLTLAQYGDYVAYYLAMCYGVDPAVKV
jgi:glucose/mannose-6-phosphate isomerase